LNFRKIFPGKWSPAWGNQKKIIRKYSWLGVKWRYPFYNMLSDEERRLFTTRPREVTA
jgi:hypothetical protein